MDSLRPSGESGCAVPAESVAGPPCTPAPENPPAQSVPANNGRRSNDDHGIAPIEESGKQCEATPSRVIHEAVRERAVTQKDRSTLAEKAHPAFRLMTRLTEATGIRAADVRLLRVQQIHDGTIDLAQSKTGNDQCWEITPAVQAILDEAARLPGRARSMYVLPTCRGTPYTESGFQSMRRRALAAAGLKNLQFRDVRKAAVNEVKKLAATLRSLPATQIHGRRRSIT